MRTQEWDGRSAEGVVSQFGDYEEIRDAKLPLEIIASLHVDLRAIDGEDALPAPALRLERAR